MPLEVARVSELISSIFEDGGDIEEAIPVPQVKKAVLQKIMVFCKHQIEPECPTLDIPHPLPTTDLRKLIDAWYVDYIEEGVD